MKKLTYSLLKVFLAVLILFGSGCKKEIDVPPGAFDAQARSIEGSWKLIKISRNGTDMTNRLDVSQFNLTFSDNSFAINETLPFVVAGNGTWSFDNPDYPMAIEFITGTDTGMVSLTSAIYSSKSLLSLRLSPGCSGNIYEYTLERESDTTN